MTNPKGNRWRFRCPNGHTTYHYRANGTEDGKAIYCKQCLRAGERAHTHGHVVDTKTGEEVAL